MPPHGIAGDPRFFERAGPFDLATIARTAEGSAVGNGPAMFTGIAPLQTARAEHVSFLDNRKYTAALRQTQAGAVLVQPDLAGEVPTGTVAITTRQPYVAWARVCALFHPLPPTQPGIHPSAIVEPGAQIDASAEIGPMAYIGPGAEIGPGCRVGIGAMIGPGVVIGADCRIGTHVSISHALIGRRVVLHPGARIGQDGFGFAVTDAGFLGVPQLGRVLIEDDVDIGANTTIDRGSSQDTVIGAGTWIDNLVQIGHNVRLGRMCVIVAQVGISGSTILDDFVQVAGQAGFVGHLHIGKGAKIGAQSGIMSDVAAGTSVFGSPALPGREHLRQVAALRRLIRRRHDRRDDEQKDTD